MGLRYLSRYIDDKTYYIAKNCDFNSLMSIQKDIENARKELAQLEMDIFNRVQQIQNIVHYKEIVCIRSKSYKGNIELKVYINEYMAQDGIRLEKTNSVYGTHKQFRGNEKKQAIAYANELKSKHHHPIVFENWK
jgi:hypothetical protein